MSSLSFPGAWPNMPEEVLKCLREYHLFLKAEKCTCLLSHLQHVLPSSTPSSVFPRTSMCVCLQHPGKWGVCAPFPLSTSSCESKGTSIITLILLLCLFIELVTHLYQLPTDSTDNNKIHLFCSNHLSESASLTLGCLFQNVKRLNEADFVMNICILGSDGRDSLSLRCDHHDKLKVMNLLYLK